MYGTRAGSCRMYQLVPMLPTMTLTLINPLQAWTLHQLNHVRLSSYLCLTCVPAAPASPIRPFPDIQKSTGPQIELMSLVKEA